MASLHVVMVVEGFVSESHGTRSEVCISCRQCKRLSLMVKARDRAGVWWEHVQALLETILRPCAMSYHDVSTEKPTGG